MQENGCLFLAGGKTQKQEVYYRGEMEEGAKMRGPAILRTATACYHLRPSSLVFSFVVVVVVVVQLLLLGNEGISFLLLASLSFFVVSKKKEKFTKAVNEKQKKYF